MAEPLKNHYGPDVPRRIASMIETVHPAFPTAAFLDHALHGYEALELLPRGRRIAHSLHEFLPQNYEQAINILLASLGPRPESQAGDGGMAPFLYLPHAHFVASYGLNDFETSMRAQYELTQRFTCEFSIRPFLEQHREATLVRLEAWTEDPDEHVRRLVSEGTRTRLPWASRLRDFQRDPTPVIDLLERLRDDPSLYVRRSVANNLNDIGKDHPKLLTDTALRWARNASNQRHWIIRHALRSAVKRGDPEALEVLGYGEAPSVTIGEMRIDPSEAREGDRLRVEIDLHNDDTRTQALLADLRVHYVKANGSQAPKVFKMKTLDLAPGESATVGKTLSLAPMTTRRHYPGRHDLELLLNGHSFPVGHFQFRD